MTRVLVCGSGGKMGAQVVKALMEDKDLTFVGGVDIHRAGEDAGIVAGVGQLDLSLLGNLNDAIEAVKPDVVVDFTSPKVVYENAKIVLAHKVHCVIGTTGLTEEQRNDLHELSLAQKANVLVAPNFSLGAVMMMKVAGELAPYFPNVEIIELHHNHKYDSPSGTSILTAKIVNEAREKAGVQKAEDLTKESLAGARGAMVDDIPIHSVRLPGYVAHQEVLFGGTSEILTIRHDSLHRESFMPGVMLACKKIKDFEGLTYGLEHYL